jgi:hypothetical protein
MGLTERVEELLRDHQIYHDDVQIARFIVGATERTAFGAYRQCLRELYRRYRGLKELYLARARLRLRISGYQRWGWVLWGRPRRRLALHEALLAREDQERNIEDTAREFRTFLHYAEALKERLGPLTAKRRRVLEMEQWEHELATRARFAMALGGPLDRGTAEAICAMPEESIQRIIERAGLERLPPLPRPCEDAMVIPLDDQQPVSIAALEPDQSRQ